MPPALNPNLAWPIKQVFDFETFSWGWNLLPKVFTFILAFTDLFEVNILKLQTQ